MASGWHCTLCGRRAWKDGNVGAPFIHYGWGPLCPGGELVWKDERGGAALKEARAGESPVRGQAVPQQRTTLSNATVAAFCGWSLEPVSSPAAVSLVPPGAQAKLGLGATCAPSLVESK